MKLFVVRHGETDWNSKMMACGVSEASLTEKGKIQAKELAKRLASEQDKNKISFIYVSPLKRAIATAAYIEKALSIKAKIDEKSGLFSLAATHKDPIFAQKVVLVAVAYYEKRFAELGLDGKMTDKENLEKNLEEFYLHNDNVVEYKTKKVMSIENSSIFEDNYEIGFIDFFVMSLFG